jgi:hypothetical protein
MRVSPVESATSSSCIGMVVGLKAAVLVTIGSCSMEARVLARCRIVSLIFLLSRACIYKEHMEKTGYVRSMLFGERGRGRELSKQSVSHLAKELRPPVHHGPLSSATALLRYRRQPAVHVLGAIALEHHLAIGLLGSGRAKWLPAHHETIVHLDAWSHGEYYITGRRRC